MNNPFKWLAYNTPFALGIAYLINNQGPYLGQVENVVLAVTWVTIAITPFLLSDIAINAAVEKKQSRSVPAWVDVTFDVCVFASFAWLGWMITAFFYAAHIVLGTGFWGKVEEGIIEQARIADEGRTDNGR